MEARLGIVRELSVKAQSLLLQLLDAVDLTAEVRRDALLRGVKASKDAAVADLHHFPSEGLIVGHPRSSVALSEGFELFADYIALIPKRTEGLAVACVIRRLQTDAEARLVLKKRAELFDRIVRRREDRQIPMLGECLRRGSRMVCGL